MKLALFFLVLFQCTIAALHAADLKELYVQLLAYGYSRPAPIAAVPDENVIIASVSNFPGRGPAEREKAMRMHADWSKKATDMLANWAGVDVMEKEYPPFAINWRSVFAIGTPGGRNKRTEGLHPGAPLSPKTLGEMNSADLE